MLTLEQQKLASNPKSLRMAKYFAYRAARRRNRPDLLDELYSAALYGLVDAARRFNPSAGVDFNTYAKTRVFGAIIDYERSMNPKGFQRNFNKDEYPAFEPIEDLLLESKELPVDHFLEWEDWLRAIAKYLPLDHRGVFLLATIQAGFTMKRIGQEFGYTESYAARLMRESISIIREKQADKYRRGA